MPDKTGASNTVNSERGEDDANALQSSLITVPISGAHRTADFVCSNSARVTGFFTREAKALVPHYCRVFIAPNPDDPNHIWGYYTLSAALLWKSQLTGSDEKRASKNYLGLPAPMIRIGFMGRDDSAQKGLGAMLLIDAARRVARNGDIAAWGLVLESEGGRDNPKLWAWYQAQGFKICRGEPGSTSLYAPLSAFLPDPET
jgi:GNAT superfamily N-acetyltransferase